jgi:DNA ligase-3
MSTSFALEYAKTSQSKCKECRIHIIKGDIRMAKIVPNFYHGNDGETNMYYHVECIFESFKRARTITKIIDSSDDVQGFAAASDAVKTTIINLIKGLFISQNFKISTKKNSHLQLY